MEEPFIRYEFVAEHSKKVEARTLIRKHVVLGVQRRKRRQREARLEEGSAIEAKTLADPLVEVSINAQSYRTLSSVKDSKTMVLRQNMASFATYLNTLQMTSMFTGSQSSGTFVGSSLQKPNADGGIWNEVPPSPVRADPFGMCTWGDGNPYLGECADFCKHNIPAKLLSVL